eukprot:6820891-Alexandrium_andersonii.AAC.1
MSAFPASCTLTCWGRPPAPYRTTIISRSGGRGTPGLNATPAPCRDFAHPSSGSGPGIRTYPTG